METGRLADLPQGRRSTSHQLSPRTAWLGLGWIVALVLLWLALRQANLAAAWEAISSLKLWQVAVLIAANLFILGLYAWRWRLGVLALGHRVGLGSLLAYRLAGFGVSYFTPGPQVGGEPLQAYLLSRRQGLAAGQAAAGVYFDRLVDMLSNFSVLAVGLVVLSLTGGHASDLGARWAGAGGVLVFPIMLLGSLWAGGRPLTAVAERMRVRWQSGRLARAFTAVAEMENQVGRLLHERPAEVLKILLTAAVIWLALIVEFGLMLRFLGVPVSGLQVLAILTMARLAILMPIPAGLGVLEAGLALGMQMVGYDPAVGIAAAFVIRARDFALGGLGLWLAGWLVRNSDRIGG